MNIGKVGHNLFELQTENIPKEYNPLIKTAKATFVQIMKALIAIKRWVTDPEAKVWKEPNISILVPLLESLVLIRNIELNELSFFKEKNLAELLRINSQLSLLQFYLLKWLYYLHKRYHETTDEIEEFVLS
jgi:hypothetical protein